MGLFGRKKKKLAETVAKNAAELSEKAEAAAAFAKEAEAENAAIETEKASEASGTAEPAETPEEAAGETDGKPELSDYDRGCIIFAMQLLFMDKVETADPERAKEVLCRHCEAEGLEQAGSTIYAAPKLARENSEGKKVPPMLMISDGFEPNIGETDALTRSQMWACARHDEILDGCKYSILATDMMTYGLEAKERANLLMDFLEGLMELYPECEAVFFPTSGQLMERSEILELCKTVDRDDRFVIIAVNCRYFRIEGTEDDKVVDTVGMGVLGLPDVQYHFHGLEPNDVVNHARNVALYIYENDCPIKGGDTIDGIGCSGTEPGNKWICQFEDSLLEPKRPLMDVCPGKYAAGTRHFDESEE